MAASRLAGRAGYGDVQVVNAGVIGYSSFQVLQFLKDAGLSVFEPEVVVICAGVNDSWRATMSDREQYERNMRITSRVRYVLMSSNLFLFLDRYVTELAMMLRTGRNPAGFGLLFTGKPGPLRVVRNSPEEGVENLGRAGDLIEKAGAKVVLILQQTRGKYPRNWVPEIFWRERRNLADVACRRNWRTIEISALNDPPLEMPADSCLIDFCHLTSEAHAIVGSWLADAVVELLEPS
jgi:hypothetical protein